MKKYGVDIASKCDEIKLKEQQTFMSNHHNYKNNFCLEEVREKINAKIRTPEVAHKKVETCFRKYGVEHVLQSPDIMMKKLQTTQERYGSPFYVNKEKEYQTKKANGSYLKHKTKCEQEVENLLLKKYSPEDIIYQYRDKRYPFVVDFYIKSVDIYIEVNGNWTHGPHPFNKDNSEDLKLLEKWQEKAVSSNYYRNAIYT